MTILHSQDDLFEVADQWQKNQQQHTFEQAYANAGMISGAQAVFSVLAGIFFLLIVQPVPLPKIVPIMMAASWLWAVPLYASIGWFWGKRQIKKRTPQWAKKVAEFKQHITAQNWGNPLLKELWNDPTLFRILSVDEINALNERVQEMPEDMRRKWNELLTSPEPLRQEQAIWINELLEAHHQTQQLALNNPQDPNASEQYAHRLILSESIQSVPLGSRSVLEVLTQKQSPAPAPKQHQSDVS